MGFSICYTTERNKETPEEKEETVHDNEMHQHGHFYRLISSRSTHFENIKPHNPSTEVWCIPEDMEEGNYLMTDPAFKAKEKCTREKNDGNE